MLRRWLIRMPFLLALALVVGLWVGSYFGSLRARFTVFHAVDMVSIEGEEGVFIDTGSYSDFPYAFEFDRHATLVTWAGPPKILGFGYAKTSNTLLIVSPLCWPGLLIAGLSWYVWRKTKPKQKSRAFPVEPQKQEAETK